MTEPLPALPDDTTHTTVDVQAVTVGHPSWLSSHLRNLVVLAVSVIVCYLAWMGNERAVEALIVTFVSLTSYLFGERSALKVPGRSE